MKFKEEQILSPSNGESIEKMDKSNEKTEGTGKIIKPDNRFSAIVTDSKVPIPNNDIRFLITNEIHLNSIEFSEINDTGFIVILCPRKYGNSDINSLDDIYEYAAIGKVNMKIKLTNGDYKVRVNVVERFRVDAVIIEDNKLFVEGEGLQSETNENDELTALNNLVFDKVLDNPQMLFKDHKQVVNMISNNVSLDVVFDFIIHELEIPYERKVNFLADYNINQRIHNILVEIQRIYTISELENTIDLNVKKSMEENQKEYYLREKMKAIQSELGDKAKKEEEIEKIRAKVKEAKMPDEVEKRVLKEVQRYSTTPSSVAESGIIKQYLDFVTDLPWSNFDKDEEDLSVVLEKLESKHHGIDKVKDRIVEYLAVRLMTKKNPPTILCLAGPPGVGKTSLAASIAEAMGRSYVKQSLGGVKDESEIRGHRRTYIGALPGRILRGMKNAGVCNPVYLLDEIDKMSSDFKGDPTSAMLEVLDPEQNSKFSDHYLEEEYDLSNVLFIATANYLENIPAPLRDRMEIVELSSYTEHEKFNIARKHLISKQLELHGLEAGKFNVTDEAIYMIIRNYTREAGVRELDRLLGTLIRKVIKNILIEKKESYTITDENLTDYLGKVKYTYKDINKGNQVGIVNGLSYSEVGGATLQIEATVFPGKGKFKVTPSPKEQNSMMTDSLTTIVSYLKTKKDEFGIPREFKFEENDIHVNYAGNQHIGGVDGPSAGQAMTIAILSAITGREVKEGYAMTGAIDLRGNSLVIGGLKEKSIGAHRSGIKKIFIPKENEKDIEDIPKEVLSELEIQSVTHVTEIISEILQ